MSAIFGILDLNGGNIDPAWIKSMQNDLAHRGPDGQGLYREDSIVLGNMLLQVTPESIYDKSPYEENGLVITANARLDEREALMNGLNIDPEEREKTTDPVLLLRSYLKYGKDFVKDIYGDFTFAIWDKEKKELFCARDQMGVKPFLYYFEDNRFVFSTELKAIVKLPFVKTEIDQCYLRNRVIHIREELGKTTWKKISRLESASTLTFFGPNVLINRYWLPIYKRNNHFKNEESSTSALRKLLEKVIGEHTRVIGEVGAPLSGGLDSSTLVCIAARKLFKDGKKITTSSSIFKPGFSDPTNPDEMEYINEVLKQEKNIDPTFIFHSELGFLNNLNKTFNRHFAPVNGFYYVDEALTAEFRSKSIRRVLSGYAGDYTVSNWTINPFFILLFTGKFIILNKLTKRISIKSNQHFSAFIKSSIISELAPEYIKKAWNKFKGRKIINSYEILEHPLILKPKERLILQKKVSSYFHIPNIHPKSISQHIWPKNIDLFEEDWDCITSHNQIEMTYPMADRRIVELLLQIPVEHFYSGGVRRGLIRNAMIGVLPEKIRTRNDKGCYSPGYPQIFKQDLTEIINLIRAEASNNQLKTLIDFDKLKFELENLLGLKNSDNFVHQTWTLIEFVIWIKFNRWFTNFSK